MKKKTPVLNRGVDGDWKNAEQSLVNRKPFSIPQKTQWYICGADLLEWFELEEAKQIRLVVSDLPFVGAYKIRGTLDLKTKENIKVFNEEEERWSEEGYLLFAALFQFLKSANLPSEFYGGVEIVEWKDKSK